MSEYLLDENHANSVRLKISSTAKAMLANEIDCGMSSVCNRPEADLPTTLIQRRNMLNLKFLTLIFFSMFSLSVAADDTKILYCRSLQKGVTYTGEIKIVAGKVDEYTYVSMNKSGNDCNLSASRHDRESEWNDGDNGTSRVTLYSDGEEIGKVLLVSTPPRYTIRLLPPLAPSVCAMGASIENSVTLTENVARCELKE